MDYNLLQKKYDKQCEMFINGIINYSEFEYLETIYLKYKKIFIICLN